jgi:NodT family efflux transporter outer membrane factor (OMF) lipoprotein
MKMSSPRVAASAALLLLAGCTVGPDFHAPDAPADRAFTAPDEQPVTDQEIKLGQRIEGEWWDLFGSPPLSGVVKQANASNRTLAAAEARLAQAREAVIAAAGGLLPQMDLAAAASRQKVSLAAFGLSGAGFGPSGGGSLPPFSLFTLGPSVSYALDVFGGTRRGIEQRAAEADDTSYRLAAAYLTVSGNAVAASLTMASVASQLKEVDAIVAEDESTLDLVRSARAAGAVSNVDVLSAESQLANDRTLVAPLKQQLSVARHALGLLLGATPASWNPPAFDLDSLTLPRAIPVTLPSELVHQRPDILSAEANLHAASAAVGVATARLYPSITLSASVTQETGDIGHLFTGPANVWNLAAGLTAPLFHGGTLSAEKRAAVDAYQAALADYQQIVLQSFAQVADLLEALAHDGEQLAAQRRAMEASNASLALTRESYRAGNIGLLQVLDAERLNQQARLGFVRARAQQFLDTAQLYVALGGGWWNWTPKAANS